MIFLDKKKILIVDDDPSIVNLIVGILQQADQGKRLTLLAAENGKNAMNLLTREKPDLMLLDVNMPDISGLELLENVRKHKDLKVATVPVLMLTVQRDPVTVMNAVRKGAGDYLGKPFHWTDLLERVKKLLKV